MPTLVMPGLVPGIDVLAHPSKKDVDGRDKPGHDETNPFQGFRNSLKLLAAFFGQAQAGEGQAALIRSRKRAT
jgi:hypothetical protein